MATSTEEIAIKLGIRNADLKAALADSGLAIKRFKKDGESTGDDGLLGTLKKSTKALTDFRSLFLSGAIAAAVTGFYRLAVDHANKVTDATDENSRAVRDFAKALDETKGAAGSLATTVIGTVNRLGEAIGDAVNITRSFIANGRDGFEVWARVQDLIVATTGEAEAAERRLAEVRKKHGAEFLAITREIASTEEKARDQRLKGLTVYETERNLFARVAELKAQLANFDGAEIERRRLMLDLAKAQLAADDATLAVKKDQAAQAKKRAEEEEEEYAKRFENDMFNLEQLRKQKEEAKEQLAIKKQLVITARLEQVEAEKLITYELSEQVRAAAQLNEEKARAAAIDRSRKGTIEQRGDVRNLNETQLDQLIQNLNRQLGPIKASDASYGGVGTAIGSYKSIEQLMLQQNLDAAIAEARLRRDFAQTLARFGDEKAQRMFAPADYERLAQLFNPDLQKQQAAALTSIDRTLGNLFPQQYAGRR
jgi:hypothetical protein